MRRDHQSGTVVRRTLLLVTVGAFAGSTGCSNPYSTVAKIGIRVVGQVVNDADVKEHARLVGQPAAAADAAFGRRLRTLEEIETAREMMTYPVKDDVLNMFRWAVEVENGAIVAVAKLQNDPSGGKDIAEKLVLQEIVNGRTPQQVQSHGYFKKLVLILRDSANGNLIRVYDIALIPDFMGAKYCLLRFDASNTCQEVRIVGVPASTPGSAVGH